MATSNPYSEVTVVPRIAVQFPLTLPTPPGFDVARPSTWPVVTGRLEYVEGRLEYMPPCGEIQQRTVVDVVTELNLWCRDRSGFVVGSNEAGMRSAVRFERRTSRYGTNRPRRRDTRANLRSSRSRSVAPTRTLQRCSRNHDGTSTTACC